MIRRIEMKEFFYHLRKMDTDGNGGYRQVSDWAATVCLLVGDDVFKPGVAVCSPKDQFNKRIGRNIAKGRAQKSETIKLDELAPLRAIAQSVAREYINDSIDNSHRVISDLGLNGVNKYDK